MEDRRVKAKNEAIEANVVKEANADRAHLCMEDHTPIMLLLLCLLVQISENMVEEVFLVKGEGLRILSAPRRNALCAWLVVRAGSPASLDPHVNLGGPGAPASAK